MKRTSIGAGRTALAVLAVAALVVAVATRTRDASADTVSAPISLGPSPQSPRVVAIAPNGKVYISNHFGNSLSVISTGNDTLIDTIPNVTHPGAIHISDTGRVYVPDHDPAGGTITVIDSGSDAPVAGSPASTGGLSPSSIDTTPGDSRIVITNENSNSVMVLDHDLNVVKYLTDAAFNKPHEVLIAPSGKAYVANKGSSEVTVVDVTAPVPSVVGHIAVGMDPDSLRFVHGELWVANFLSSPGTISRINISTDTTIGSPIPVGDSPHGLDDNADSSLVLVANQSSNTVSVLDGGGNLITTLDVGIAPQRIHMTDDGKRAYVPNEGGDSVSVIDLAASPPRVVATLDQTSGIGAAPSSVSVFGHSKVYVANKDDNTVSVITIEEQSASPPTSTVTALPTDTPRPGDTPRPTASREAVASATPPPEGSPAVPASPDGGDPTLDAGIASPASGVAGAAATPPPGATAEPSGTAHGSTPSAVPSRGAGKTAASGVVASDVSTPDASGDAAASVAASGGGAPSWIWLALGLGVVAALGAGGFLGRDRIATLLSRVRK